MPLSRIGRRTAPGTSASLLLAAALAASTPAVTAAAQPGPARPGASATRIVVDSVDLTGVTTLSELLQARAPGLLVQTASGLAGSGARLTSRGRHSVYAPDEPLLVVDGVRVVGGRRGALLDSTFLGSRYDDVPVEQIAAVEVLPGPAAAARYGPGAATGAVVVTTRRARPGRAERRLYADVGAGAAAGERPTFYRGMGRLADGSERGGCTITNQVAGDCTLTRVEAVRPYDAAPWRVGARARAGGRLSGGGDRARYLVGVDGARLGGPLTGSDATRGTLRASADLQPARTLRVALGATALTQTTDALLDALAPRVDLAVNAPVRFAEQSGVADVALATARLDANATVDWAARPWLRTHAAFGTSHARQRERSRRELFGAGATRLFVNEGAATGRDRVTVAELGAGAEYRLAGAALATTLTAQQVADRSRDEVEHTSRVVTVGGDDGSPGSGSGYRRQRLADVRGLALAQRLAAGRLTAGGTLRLDQVGDDWTRVTSGSADAAYRVWARGVRAVDVRGAFGTAVGGPSAGLPLLFAGFVIDRGALVEERAPALPRSERTREAEVGVDAALGPGVTARLTYYDQHTRDVLVPGPPTAGTTGFAPALATMGLRNRGAEASLAARLVGRPGLAATLGLRAWVGRNRVVDLAAPEAILFNGGGAYHVLRDGAPLGAFYGLSGASPVRDLDGDGFVTRDEASRATQALSGGPAGARRVIGTPTPTRTLAADLRGRAGARLTFAALLEHQGGYQAVGDVPALHNAARASVDPTAPVAVQAYVAGARLLPETRLQPAGFVRIREVSVGWHLGGPDRRDAAQQGTTVTLAGRNLLTSTRYRGLDPEATLAPGAVLTVPALSAEYAVPLARTVALRVTRAW